MYEHPLTPALSVSFQRYPYPPGGLLTALPTSWGALPLGTGPAGRLLLPCPDGEAFWIGLVWEPGHAPSPVRVVAELASGDRVDAENGAPGPPYAVPGIPRGDGTWWALARAAGVPAAPTCVSLELRANGGSLGVDVVEPARLAELDADPLPPLDPARRYGGWRLP